MKFSTAVARTMIFFLIFQNTAAFAQNAINYQNAISDAQALGAAASASIQGNLNTATAAQQTPGFTASPPQAGLDQTDLKSAASIQYSQCQGASKNDPTCQGITTAQSDAQLRGTSSSMVSPYDPSITSAKAISSSPGSVIAGIQGTYSNCGTTTTVNNSTTIDTQSCYWYLLRSLANSCSKTLNTSVSWSCPSNYSGTISSTQFTGPLDNGTSYYCQQTTTTQSCPSDHPTIFYNPNGSIAACESMAWPFDQVAPTSTVTTANADANPNVNQWWSSDCGGYENRVPGGLLLPDGDNSMPYALGNPTGSPDKCVRTSSNCNDTSPATRVFDRYPVTSACWGYTNTFDCIDQQPTSTCGQPRYGNCSLSQSSCVEYDVLDPQYCNTIRNDYSCSSTQTQSQTGVNCNNQVYTDPQGNAWPAGAPPGQNFAKVVTGLELVREAGMYMDSNSIFAGEDDRCDMPLFGLVNCCNKGGANAAALFTDLSVIGANYADYGKVLGTGKVSAYTYGSLFKGGAGNAWISVGMELISNDELFWSLYDVYLGTATVEEFLAVMIPGPWSLVILVIIASGILNCPDQAISLGMKRDANLCVDIGEYCSQYVKLLFAKWCVKRTHTYCCFVSKLAKIINTQGKAQLGIGMGSAQSPNCGGLTLSQIQSIDFSQIDMSEFMSSITCTVGSQTMPCDQVGTMVPALPNTLPTNQPTNQVTP